MEEKNFINELLEGSLSTDAEIEKMWADYPIREGEIIRFTRQLTDDDVNNKGCPDLRELDLVSIPEIKVLGTYQDAHKWYKLDLERAIRDKEVLARHESLNLYYFPRDMLTRTHAPL